MNRLFVRNGDIRLFLLSLTLMHFSSLLACCYYIIDFCLMLKIRVLHFVVAFAIYSGNT